MSLVLHSVWKAPNGEIGLVMANYTTQSIKITFNPGDGLEVDKSNSSETAYLEMDIPPREIILIKLKN